MSTAEGGKPRGNNGGVSALSTKYPRLYAARGLVIALASLVLISVVLAFAVPETSTRAMAPDNLTKNGTHALATLLASQGVTVTEVRSYNELTTKTSHLKGDVTIAIPHSQALAEPELDWLSGAGADVTLVGANYASWEGLATIGSSGVSLNPGTTARAQCTDPDALAAGTLALPQDINTARNLSGSSLVAEGEDVVACFPLETAQDSASSDADPNYLYATAPLVDGTLRIIADPRLVSNAGLAEAGNAALAIRALGHHRTVLWFDPTNSTPQGMWIAPGLPPWFSALLLQLAFIVVFLAVIRGRRFGRLVYERMPVVVEASETTRGRGRLYRASHARGEAARSLRAGSALRLAKRLGMPLSSSRDALVDAIAGATHLPAHYISEALFGPVPSSDQALMDLAHQLEHIESEVNYQ